MTIPPVVTAKFVIGLTVCLLIVIVYVASAVAPEFLSSTFILYSYSPAGALADIVITPASEIEITLVADPLLFSETSVYL